MKNKYTLLIRNSLMMSLIFCSLFVNGQTRVLSNPNATAEAKALYCYIQNLSGKKILSGQMWSGWGFDELKYISDNTGGKQPAVMGVDLIQESVNNTQMTLATNWWKKGGIPTVMWHFGAPTHGEGYPSSQLTIDIRNCFIAGTPEYTAFWAELAKKADHLQTLKDAKVPVLWRPYHELNGGWFWWGKGTGATGESNASKAALFKQLWTTTYDYMVNTRKLDNLIWVLCYTGSPDAAWFPGNQYVDIAGGDEYASTNDPQQALYNNVKKAVAPNLMPTTLHECGVPPDPDQMLAKNCLFSWFMLWHTSYVQNLDKTYLKTLYNHNLVVTLDEVGSIMTACGTTTCPATTILPFVQVNGGAAQAVNTVTVNSGAKLVLGPQPTTGGTWAWTGCGTSGTNREQTLSPTTACTATATYTNACGTKSTLDFKISIIGAKTCCGNTTTNGYAYCCTNSDPDGDGYGWENNASCIVPSSAADPDKCSTVVTSVDLGEEVNSLNVYPNPFTTEITIKTKSQIEYSVFDMTGKIMERGSTSADVSIGSELPTGIYTLQMKSLLSEKNMKIIKK